MAKMVVRRDQQAEVRRRYPKPAYSRVVSVMLGIWPPAGLTYSVTPPLGNKIWLLSVRAWCERKAVDRGQLTYFDVYSGSGTPSRVQDVASWGNILPVSSSLADVVNWGLYDGDSGFTWSMMRHFEGSGIRFGAVAGRVGEDYGVLFVSFEISEG